MDIKEARELAAAAWTTSDTEHIVMDPVLAEAFAHILMKETTKAHAGIDRLADFVMQEVPGEPSQSEGVVDCVIRLLRAATQKPPQHNDAERCIRFYPAGPDGKQSDFEAMRITPLPEAEIIIYPGDPRQVTVTALVSNVLTALRQGAKDEAVRLLNDAEKVLKGVRGIWGNYTIYGNAQRTEEQ